ncbi:alpha-L-fucosidase [Bacteroidota bacterium]
MMKKKALYLFLLVITLANCSRKEPENVSFEIDGKWEATWESLKTRPYPQWFKDAKLGIFIHWGVYSVPAYGEKESYGEWFLRGLQLKEPFRTNFMKKNYGENFTYRDFAPLFKAELFNADEWAELFEKAGAKYMIFVSKHHDGYAMWPSKYSPGWNSVEVGPKRDLVGELEKAIRKTNVKFGLYYSLPEWNNKLHMWDNDPHDQITSYIDQYMLPQFHELISTYKPEVLFTDGEWFHSAEDWHARELISWYYNLVGDDAIVNNRWGGGSDIGFLTPEYSAGINVTDRPWAECRGLGRSFGLNRNEKLEAYLSPEELIHFFAKAVGNGGGITLNVGPKADGQIPLLQQERLMQLGNWLKVNGEAIYGSETYEKTGEERRMSVKRIDKNLDFNWVRNTPAKTIKEDDFEVVWTGYIKAKYSEKYLFEARADEGCKIWINNKEIGDKGEVELIAQNKYPIRIEYFEKKNDAHMHLYWSSESQEKEIIPQPNLYSSKSIDAGDGLLAEYSSMNQHIAYTCNNNNLYVISLEWPDDTLVLDIPKPANGIKISMLGLEKSIPYTYRNNKLYIDVSGISYNEMPCDYAWVFKISLYPSSP